MEKTGLKVLKKRISADTISNHVYDICQEFSKVTGMDFDECLIYLEMRRLGPKTASTLAKELNLDRNKIYRTIDNLENIGFVSMTLSSPKLCIAEEPSKIFSLLIKKKQNEIEAINRSIVELSKKIENISSNQSKNNLITFKVVEGLQNIYLSISDLLEKSKNKIYIVMSIEDILRMYHSDIVEKIAVCKKNGGSVFLITDKIEKQAIPIINEINPTQIRLGKPPSKGRIIVSEDSSLIMTESKESNSFLDEELDVALVTNSTEMRKNIFTLCEFLWEIAVPLESHRK